MPEFRILPPKWKFATEPPPATYHQGQMFYEAPNLVHATSRNASTMQPAKLLVFFVGDKGQTLTAPVQ